MRTPVLFLAATTLIACGPRDENNDGIADGIREPNSVTLVAPSRPVGTLSGQVLTTRFAPLPDARVRLTLGARSAELQTSTDTEGNFSFTHLPAGSQVLVTITKEAHATLRLPATIPSTAGNFPINDANASIGAVTLTQLSGALKLMVLTRGGKPARGVRVTVEATPAGTVLGSGPGYGTHQGLVVQETTVGDDGLVNVTGIPGAEELARLSGGYSVVTGAYDEDNDGTPEFSGTAVNYLARDLVTDPSVRIITLPDARTSNPLSIVATNVDSMITANSQPSRNMVKPNDTLYFLFNQPVLESSLVVRLTDESGLANLTYSRTLKNGDLLTVQPTASVENGREYNVLVRATSAANGSVYVGRAYFFGGDPANPKPFAVSTIQWQDTTGPMGAPDGNLNMGERVIIRFNQPIKLIGGFAAEAFIDYDFAAPGTVTGEKGAPNGFPIVDSEPTQERDRLFDLVASGYTSRFVFVPSYGGTANAIPRNTQILILFSRLSNVQGGYQTIWGVPVTSDESAPLALAQ